jgi:predicted DNA-binding WGR domain protein
VIRNLICRDPARNANKLWRIRVVGSEHHLEWGRVGTNGQTKTKTFSSPSEAVDQAHAVIAEKLAKGYVDVQGIADAPAPAPTPDLLPDRPRPMLAREIDADRDLIPFAASDDHVFEHKLDGDRVMLVIEDGKVSAIGRNGQTSKHCPLFEDRRHAPELARLSINRPRIVIDGELVDGVYWIFDMPGLEWSSGIQMKFTADEAWKTRRRALGLVFQAWQPSPSLFRLLPYAGDEESKLELAHRVKTEGGEGIIVKNVNARYAWGGENMAVLKAKFWNDADLVVLAVGHGGKNNAVLGAMKDGRPVEVGRTSTNGKGTVRVDDIVCVKYLYLGANGRLVQPDLVKVRHDKDTADGLDSLKRVNKEVS